MDRVEMAIYFCLVFVLVFFLAFGAVPRALGHRDVPDKIEKIFCGETKKGSTVVWYHGYGPKGGDEM